MHADPQQAPDPDSVPTLRLLEQPGTTTLAPLVFRFLALLRQAVWRAFQHDAFATAKASAYSSILTFFPSLLAVGSVLAARRNTQPLLGEVSNALKDILPTGAATAQAYLRKGQANFGVILTTSLLALWLASGVMISWMEGFRRAYELPKTWGLIKERLVSLLLVILAGIPLSLATILVAFGNRIELRILSAIGHEFSPYV